MILSLNLEKQMIQRLQVLEQRLNDEEHVSSDKKSLEDDRANLDEKIKQKPQRLMTKKVYGTRKEMMFNWKLIC